MPKATVAAIIHNDRAQVLLTRRNITPFKGLWILPGGHIEDYEAAQTAIVREVKEETGLDFAATFFGYFDEIIPDMGIHAVVIVFVGTPSGEAVADGREVSELAWFSLDEARALELGFQHNIILDAFNSANSR